MLYKTLPNDTSIRLLYIDHISDLQPIQLSNLVITGSIRTIDLNDESAIPIYTCLSYTWGSPFPPSHPLSSRYNSDTACHSQRSTITIDGEEMAVTLSLYEALLHLREDFPTRLQPIWVDAICIDQRNPEGNTERAKQVAFMDRIYLTAEHVAVWLGPSPYVESSTIVSALRNLANVNVNALGIALMRGAIDISDPEVYTTLEIPLISREVWIQIRGFYERSWFQRTWVMQEAALARSISFHIGANTLSWKEVEDASHILYRLGVSFARHSSSTSGIVQNFLESEEDLRVKKSTSLAFSSINTIEFVRRQHERYGIKRAFQGSEPAADGFVVSTRDYGGNPESWRDFRTLLLYKTRSNQASDSRDKIYAFLGLLRGVTDGNGHNIIVPDYSNSNSIRKLYTMITRKLTFDAPEAAHSGRYTLPDMIVPPVEDRSLRNVKELPSWVPDYSAPDLPRPIISSAIFHYRASAHLNGGLIATNDPYCIEIRGLMVGNISAVGESYGEIKATSSIRKCLDLLGKLPNGVTRGETLASTLVADLSLGFQVPSDEVKAIFRSYLAWLKASELHCQWSSVGNRPRAKRLDLLDIQTSCHEFHILEQDWRPRASDILDIFVALQSGNSSRSVLSVKTSLDLASRYESNLDRLFDYRRFFLTSEGNVGIGPRSIKPGDEVWLLPPERTFHVLRRLTAEEHEMLGDAYVHGLMFGELAKYKSEEDLMGIRLV
ncbi:MAG: hypothetical protein M1820_005706 [Bogoriella megaspora]|nr:MAG: hypothetical protein M1820_005706 [Bogoriella megaspora]